MFVWEGDNLGGVPELHRRRTHGGRALKAMAVVSHFEVGFEGVR